MGALRRWGHCGCHHRCLAGRGTSRRATTPTGSSGRFPRDRRPVRSLRGHVSAGVNFWRQLAAKIRAWRDLREAAALLRAGAEAYGVDELEGLLAIRRGAGVALAEPRERLRSRSVSCDSGKLRSPSGPTERAMTAQGHPRAIFKRAIEHGNVTVAEVIACERARISLGDALDLTALVAREDPSRGSRYATRWLRRHSLPLGCGPQAQPN